MHRESVIFSSSMVRVSRLSDVKEIPNLNHRDFFGRHFPGDAMIVATGI